jgi:valyl-tRNA synthetase
MKLPKAYEPSLYESDIYALWEQSKAFEPVFRHGSKQTFTTVMPPPNANANLHIGHSLNYALIDISARYHRLKGDATLVLPGADHAGFETQVVYEKHLAKEGKSRFDYSREELYEGIYSFVQGNKHNFEGQLRSLGVSCDWSRFTFTLDEKVVKTAYTTFKKMWDDGLIYRGERLVNYCTHHRTSFADIEVVYEERKSPLYYLKYGPFTLATTRPETKFGDTAVAVHPDDERYKKYVGTTITVDGLNGPFELRVIADDMVDREFGTGAVKITPAHDFNDFEAGKRHNLPAVRVINHDGTLNHIAGKFAGMTVAEGRLAVAEALKKKGLLEKVDEDYTNRVGTCYKCGTVIEPMLMDQWFVDMKKLAEPAIKAVKGKGITFFPDAKKEQVVQYLHGVKDWNISRQIAWGIPIPAFQNVNDADDWIFDERVGEEILEVDGKTYRRDPDVFDTWFSSGQWPFVTLNYPDHADFAKYYPTDLMETGIDILYQWVARMICLGLYVTGKMPFKDVYLHGMVRSEDGRKMSKSLGNVIDPKEIITSHGSDALRMGIIAGRSAGYSAAYAPSKIDAGRNFANKLWNIARFVEDKFNDEAVEAKDARAENAADHWILSKLQQSAREIGEHIEAYRFSEAFECVYHTVWDDVADWYIEASKERTNRPVLAEVLRSILILAHPFAPFVTETIWQTLSWTGSDTLATQMWPQAYEYSESEADTFDEIRTIVGECRAIIANLQLRKCNLYYTKVPFLEKNAALLARLAGLKEVKEVDSGHGLHLTQTKYTCWLDVDEETAQRYTTKLQDQLTTLKATADRLEGRLANKSYVANAPKELVAETQKQLAETKELLAGVTKELARYSTNR